MTNNDLQGTRDSQYLNLLATDPDFQRKGIATKLLKTVHDRARIIVPRTALNLIVTNLVS